MAAKYLGVRLTTSQGGHCAGLLPLQDDRASYKGANPEPTESLRLVRSKKRSTGAQRQRTPWQTRSFATSEENLPSSNRLESV